MDFDTLHSHSVGSSLDDAPSRHDRHQSLCNAPVYFKNTGVHGLRIDFIPSYALLALMCKRTA
eukprot:1142710-Pelagomonas_calceolata.AAC.1